MTNTLLNEVLLGIEKRTFFNPYADKQDYDWAIHYVTEVLGGYVDVLGHQKIKVVSVYVNEYDTWYVEFTQVHEQEIPEKRFWWLTDFFEFNLSPTVIRKYTIMNIIND